MEAVLNIFSREKISSSFIYYIFSLVKFSDAGGGMASSIPFLTVLLI